MPQFPAVIQLSALNGADGFLVAGLASGDRSGTSVASAGDVNGDGFDDFINGATGVNAGGGVGASYVVFGKRYTLQRVVRSGSA